MRVAVDLTKASTEIVDLSDKLNPRVGDGDLALPFHITYDGQAVDMHDKDIEFISQDTDGNDIYVAGTTDTSTSGDNAYQGDVTFKFPEGTFKKSGTYDTNKTMFRIVNKADNTVISTVNVKLTVLDDGSAQFNFDPTKTGYNSRMEDLLKEFKEEHEKHVSDIDEQGQKTLSDAKTKVDATLDDVKAKADKVINDANTQAQKIIDDAKSETQKNLDEIKQLNNEAKGNVAGDTAATANQAKELANKNQGLLYDQQKEIANARGTKLTLADREDAQDNEINRKEDRQNANENYAALQTRADNQDKEIAKKANQDFILKYLSQFHTNPIAMLNENELKTKHPNGAVGVFVTMDNGHAWIYDNNKWNDCGQYQSTASREVEDARVGADVLGGKQYDSLVEALHSQAEALRNLANNTLSFDVSGTAGSDISMPNNFEIGAKTGTVIRIKFELQSESDLSVIQVYANGKHYQSITSNQFGLWGEYKLDQDVNTLGLLITSDKFTTDFSATMSVQILTEPMLNLRSALQKSINYSIGVSPSADSDLEAPNAITDLVLPKGAKIKVMLENDADNNNLDSWQLWANGKYLVAINNVNQWNEVTLTDDVNRLGYAFYTSYVHKSFNGKLRIIGESFASVYADMDNSNQLMKEEIQKSANYSIDVSPSTDNDLEVPNAITGLNVVKGSKLMVKLEADTVPSNIQVWQFWGNGKPIASIYNINQWNEITAPTDINELGYAFFTKYVKNSFNGRIKIVGELAAKVYNDLEKNESSIKDDLQKVSNYSLDVSLSPSQNVLNNYALTGLHFKKGSKIRFKLEADTEPSNISAWQLFMNGKFFRAVNDINVWHEVTLENDVNSLGYDFWSEYIKTNFDAKLKIIGDTIIDIYDKIDSQGSQNGQMDKRTVSYLSMKEKEIRNITDRVDHGISFIFMTDPHFPSNALLSKPMMKDILNNTSLPFVICGGDYPGAFGTKDDILASRDEVLEYQNYIGKNRFFSVQANHDFTIRTSTTSNDGYTFANSVVYDALIRPNEHYLDSIQAGKEYYYIDIPAQKTRIFMLNSMDGNPKEDNQVAWGTQYTISQDQADWLVAKTQEKTNWKYIFVTHVPTDSNLNSYHPSQAFFHQTAEAINGKGNLNYNQNGITVNADFANTTNQVVVILSGHSHHDESSESNNVLSVTTTSDAYYGDGGWVRDTAGYNAQAFDIVIVNYDDGTITMKRIGAGQDRLFKYQGDNTGAQVSSFILKNGSLTLNKGDKSTCEVDVTTPLISDQVAWSNNVLNWKSSNETVATVSNGEITAKDTGTATITVSTKDNKYSAECIVTVK